ncbi:hypothetical protein FM112_10090 [Gulosibacter sp. 10]|nr:hypothetical protein FM112_10090 [Gulosibacter sp. 10]
MRRRGPAPRRTIRAGPARPQTGATLQMHPPQHGHPRQNGTRSGILDGR